MINSFPDEENQLIDLKDYFEEDFQSVNNTLIGKIQNQNIILIGAAGSIGFAVLPFILSAIPRNLLLIDQDENRLTLLLRLARAKDWISASTNLTVAAMDYGSIEARHLLKTFSKEPIILNFAAAKHVRSERNTYGIAHLLRENFSKPWQLIEDLNPNYYFGISTDKAANPVNFMGASKALHEQLLFLVQSSSARFANVAFSQGSLLDSWRYRMQWNEPLVVPQDVERFLITSKDAARLCAISISKASNSAVLIPNDKVVSSMFLFDVASRYLQAKNLKPIIFEDYQKAKESLSSKNIKSNEWPLVVTNSDTPGEKKREEFLGEGELATPLTRQTSQIIPRKTKIEILQKIRHFIEKDIYDLQKSSRTDLVRFIQDAIPSFDPIYGTEILDSRP
jgi:FlaA1/EpsC-like NDP-sugar epimerase